MSKNTAKTLKTHESKKAIQALQSKDSRDSRTNRDSRKKDSRDSRSNRDSRKKDSRDSRQKIDSRQKHKTIATRFLAHYKGAKTELNFKNLYELTICVILSAQCTDKRVNLVTPNLFKKFPNIQSLANADISEVREIIKSISFFNNKAKNIIAMAQGVMERFGGEIPLNQRDLMSLSGIGQKSANVILLEFCEANLMAVDTHVFRVSHRLGLSNAKTPEATERDLNKIFLQNRGNLHQAFVLFGRYICTAQKPKCEECFIPEFCNFKRSVDYGNTAKCAN